MSAGIDTADAPCPEPATDWIDRTELACMLGISHQTAYRFERAGRFERFRHFSPVATRNRRFSRTLVERHVEDCLQRAIDSHGKYPGPIGTGEV